MLSMKMKGVKIFENGTVKECLQRCLSEGYRPATAVKVNKLAMRRIIPHQYYTTATVSFKGQTRDAELSELENIEQFYQDGGRLFFVICGCGNQGGYDGLDNDGCFVGIRDEGISETGTSETSKLKTPTLEDVVQAMQPYVPEACREEAEQKLRELYNKE